MGLDHSDLKYAIEGLLDALDRSEASGDPSPVTRAENIQIIREMIEGVNSSEENLLDLYERVKGELGTLEARIEEIKRNRTTSRVGLLMDEEE